MPGYSSPGGAVTRFADDFNRASGKPSLNWSTVPLGGNLIADPRIGACADSAQGLIIGNTGAGSKSDVAMWPAPLANDRVRGKNQFCRFDLIAEIGSGSFAGPAIAVESGITQTCYSIILRAGQWRLCRIVTGLNTDLIAPAALAIPCTLEIQIIYNGAISNTVTLLRNGVQIGSSIDSAGVIQATGIPGFYAGCPTGGDTSQWRNFVGGLL